MNLGSFTYGSQLNPIAQLGSKQDNKNGDGVMQDQTDPLRLSAFGRCLRAVRAFQAFGVSGPESFFGLFVCGFEFSAAFVRTEIMGALLVFGGKCGHARIESLPANRIYGGFRYGVRIGHGLTSLIGCWGMGYCCYNSS